MKRTMQQCTSCPDGVPNGEPPDVPKDSEDVHPPPVPPRTHPDQSFPPPRMTLRRTPRSCLRPASPDTPGAVPRKTRAGNGRPPGSSGGHEGPPPSRSAGRRVASAEPPRHRPGAKRRKRYARKPKTPDSVPGPPGAPERDADSPSTSRPFPEGLLDGPPETGLTGGPQRHGSPDSMLDSSLVSPPRRLRPEDPQSTPLTPPAKVVSKCRQTTSTPRQGSSGTQPGNSPPSSRPSSPLDQPSQHESQLSSDLSIEFSLPEEELINISFEGEEEEEEDEDELPSFLTPLSKKPASIKEGDFVWGKFRLFPFWPAVVKSVKPKLKKASIIWIDQPTIDKKRKGFSVSLRNLKPFDCEETNQLVCAAKANYAAIIDWALELINDYVFRIACSSFTGSFIEYSSHFMSNPVRRKYPEGRVEGLALPSRPEPEEEEGPHSGGEESASEAPEEGGPGAKRLLPDRTVAAHNRANQKLVTFIVSQRLADQHLLAVVRGQQASRWLRSFLKARRRLQVKPYLEDDRQLDQVYLYLKELFHGVTDHAPCLANVKFMDDVRFVLDVLLPEAIISAIAGVYNISLNKAEEKYLNGRCISEREREEFELTIGQQMS